MVFIIQNTKLFETPIIELEQYCIDAVSTVDILYFAGFEFDDISNKIVIDLGAGTGRLSIASAYLGAYMIISIDIDKAALSLLKDNTEKLNLQHLINPICSEVGQIALSPNLNSNEMPITTIMNPPFGVQTRKADRVFLNTAFSFSDVIYSIHLAGPKIREFIRDYCNKNNWEVDHILPYKMLLEKSFPFHTMKSKQVDIDIYRIIKKK